MSTHDLFVVLRAYPGISKTPLVHRQSKARLFELCVRSMARAIGDLNAKFHVLLDRETPELRDVVSRHLGGQDVEIEPLPGLGNFETFRKQLHVATTQRSAEFVMLAEDDYLYTEDSIADCVRFMRGEPTADFVTPFRHVTYEQTKAWFEEPSPLGSDAGWEVAPYTTLTFLARVASLRNAHRGFRSYCAHNFDAVLWGQLTGSLRPGSLLATAVRTRSAVLLKSFVKWVLYQPFFVGTRRPMRLCVPRRSLATHLEATDVVDRDFWLGVASRVEGGPR